MSTQETDAQPTPGPWDTDVTPKGDFCEDILGKHDGNLEVVATVRKPGDGIYRGDWKANAELIAAAGTAAHKAKEMGYDPQAAVEALPTWINELEDLRKRLWDAFRGRRSMDDSEIMALNKKVDDLLTSAEGDD